MIIHDKYICIFSKSGLIFSWTFRSSFIKNSLDFCYFNQPLCHKVFL